MSKVADILNSIKSIETDFYTKTELDTTGVLDDRYVDNTELATAVQGASQAKLSDPLITVSNNIVEGGTLPLSISNYNTNDYVTYNFVDTGCSTVRSTNNITVSSPSIAKPSFTIQADNTEWSGEESGIVTIQLQTELSAPTLVPSTNTVNPATPMTFTISGISANADKVILDLGSTSFDTFSSDNGSAVQAANNIEITGFTGTSMNVTLNFITINTYSVKARVEDTTVDGYATSQNSGTESIAVSDTGTADLQDVESTDLAANAFLINGYQ